MDKIAEDVASNGAGDCQQLSSEPSCSDGSQMVTVSVAAGPKEGPPTPQACSSAAAGSSNEETTSSTTDDADDPPEAESRLTDLMPEEQLCSDDSDTAGYYQVSANTSALTNQSSSDSTNPYQRGVLSSSSDESSMDSDFDSLANSSDEYSDYNPASDESTQPLNIDVRQVAVEGNICRQLHSRMTGDIGRKRKFSSYTDSMMSSMSFVRRLRVARTFYGHNGCVNALSFNSSGTWIASGSDDCKVYIWDVNTCKPYMNFNSGHDANVFQTKFMPYSNDTQIVTCSRDGKVRLAELSVTGKCRSTKKLAQHARSAHKLAVENDSPHCLLSAGEDSCVYQIDLREKRPTSLLKMLRVVGDSVAYYWIDKRPHSQYEFAVGGRHNHVRVYDKRKVDNSKSDKGALKSLCPKQLTSSDYDKDITCAVYSHDGSEIVASYNDDDIYLFKSDGDDGDSIACYSGHGNRQTVKGVNFFGPRSEYVVSGSDCGNVFFWDKSSQQCVQIQRGDEGIVNVCEPHPLYPYMAVSGLAHDFKLLMPVGNEPTDMGSFKKLVKRNKKHRRMNSILISAELDRQIYLSAVRFDRLRREARGNLDTDSDDDDDDDARRNARCITS